MLTSSSSPSSSSSSSSSSPSTESGYGWSKLMGEYEASLLQRMDPSSSSSTPILLPNISVLRFHNVYGPGLVYMHRLYYMGLLL
jgi:nucleoside-diphosphate-sugar epimerase